MLNKEQNKNSKSEYLGLQKAEKERYASDGYLSPVKIFSAEEINGYRKHFELLESKHGGRLSKVQSLEPALFYDWAYELATDKRVLDVIESIIGPNILVHSSTIFCKYAKDPAFISWHQDGYNWKLTEPKLVSAWIALSDSTSENGCMRVVPKSHGERISHDHKINKDNMVRSGLTVEYDIKEKDVVDIELNPGEMSLHHVRIIHGSRPNDSLDKRIGFAVRYVATSVNQKVQNHDVILARGEDHYGHYNLLSEPPSRDIEIGMKRQLKFANQT